MLDPIAAGVYFPAVTANHATAMENPLSHMPKANCALVYVPHEQFSGMPIGLKQASFKLQDWPHIVPIKPIRKGEALTWPYTLAGGWADKLFFPTPPDTIKSAKTNHHRSRPDHEDLAPLVTTLNLAPKAVQSSSAPKQRLQTEYAVAIAP